MSIPIAERTQFKVGKYEVVARPIPGSGHMLRYTVLLRGKPIGSVSSGAPETECRFLRAPTGLPPRPAAAEALPGVLPARQEEAAHRAEQLKSNCYSARQPPPSAFIRSTLKASRAWRLRTKASSASLAVRC